MHIDVELVGGTRLQGVDFDGKEDTAAAVEGTVQTLLQAEGQGSFVVETVEGWCCIPTRSILFVTVTRA